MAEVPPINDHAVQAFRRFHMLLPRGADAILVILKAHLLVEEQIRLFLEERTFNIRALSAARLDCHTAICMAEALCKEDIHPRVWEAARKLNELRNKVAHNLEPPGVEERMLGVCELIGLSKSTIAALDQSSPSNPLGNFTFAVAMLHGELSIYAKRASAEVVHLVPPEGAA